jgi:hypothetical protein
MTAAPEISARGRLRRSDKAMTAEEVNAFLNAAR